MLRLLQSLSVLATSLLCVARVCAADLEVAITLVPESPGEWRVAYALSSEVDALVFARGNGDYRTGTWRPEDDFLVERFGETDRIRRHDGTSFSQVSAVLREHAEKIPKDYTPFIRFTDGAVAAFTGQFIVGVPMAVAADVFADGANNDNTEFPSAATIAIHPGNFGRMIVASRIVESEEKYALDEGEYVYFGNADALETPTLTAVTDSGAPEWLRGLLYDSMAETYDYFSSRLGPLPGGKPVMLTNFEPMDGEHISFTGGVIGSQIVIQLGLGVDIEDGPAERRFMARFFAHESAHLWNNGRVVSVDGSEAWMHEGGAEAKAWLALSELDIHPAETARKLFENAANACIGFLGDGPLRDAGRRGGFRAYYDCGATIALATHGLMRGQEKDLFDFWRSLIDHAEAESRTYDATAYRALIATMSSSFADRLDTFTNQHHENARAELIELLEAGGVSALPDPEGGIAIQSIP